MIEKGTLYLVPTPLGKEISSIFSNKYYINIISNCRYFIVEETKTARRFLKKIVPEFPINEAIFLEFNEHSNPQMLEEYLKPLSENFNICLLSESGCPVIADPGYPIVMEAHKQGFKVVPLIGPSSIILSLMASGLPAQHFTFNGYLPRKEEEVKNKIKILEKISSRENSSQIFIETPYRNQTLFNKIVQTCNPNTWLCIASDLTQPDEFVKTMTIAQWKKNKWHAKKIPTIFIIYSGNL